MITKDSRNILVADDSVFFRTKLSDILIEAGHRVEFASDGRDVINYIKQDPGRIDLLILDIQMPNIDGFAVLQWLKDNGYKGKFPVLAVTGVYEPGQILERIRGLGASGLITKGFTPEQIVYRVNRLLFPEKTPSEWTPRFRVPVSIPADFTIGDVTQTGFLLNLSESGAYLHTKAELLQGAMLNLRFSLPGAEKILEIKGIVRWTTPADSSSPLFKGAGIMFTSIKPEDKEAVKGFVEKEAERLEISQPGS